ncbi:acidic proline-rich protein PRP25-like isoform X1 [Dysidea avara]|uniref:acidic proline-rich protein PRP25-like isoform X1 n=1 Tax=Dysidea avara TaxID=196820 RepID=UPI003328F37B
MPTLQNLFCTYSNLAGILLMELLIWKKLFEAVGISENDLMDRDVAKLICEHVFRHGGIENVIRQPEHGLSPSPLPPANIDRLPLSSNSEGSPMTPSVLLHNNEEQPPQLLPPQEGQGPQSPPHEGWRDNQPSQHSGQELPPPPGWGHPPPGWDHPPPPPPHGGWEHPPPPPPHRGWRHPPPPPHHGWRHPPPHHRGHPPPHHRGHPPPHHRGHPHHHIGVGNHHTTITVDSDDHIHHFITEVEDHLPHINN